MTTKETPDTYLTASIAELRKMFEEAKSDDLTRAGFEREKTNRIVALSSAIAAFADFDERKTKLSSENTRDELLRELQKVCGENYQPFPSSAWFAIQP